MNFKSSKTTCKEFGEKTETFRKPSAENYKRKETVGTTHTHTRTHADTHTHTHTHTRTQAHTHTQTTCSYHCSPPGSHFPLCSVCVGKKKNGSNERNTSLSLSKAIHWMSIIYKGEREKKKKKERKKEREREREREREQGDIFWVGKWKNI